MKIKLLVKKVIVETAVGETAELVSMPNMQPQVEMTVKINNTSDIQMFKKGGGFIVDFVES